MTAGSHVMKRLALWCWTFLLLWGCAPSPSQQEILSTFQAFLSNVRAGDQGKVLQAAPFLEKLPAPKRAAVFQSFQRLAAQSPGDLHMEVSRGSGEIWLLRVSVPARGKGTEGTVIVVPFHKNARGQWEMSPVIEAVQHIDVVPAR